MAPRGFRSFHALVVLITSLAACDGQVQPSEFEPVDRDGAAAPDAASDARVQVGTDAASRDDAQSPDPTEDAGSDAAPDTEQPDAGPDPGVLDAGAAIDAGRSFPTDRTAFGLTGASRCAGSDALLCDGFEGAAIDKATWTVQTWGAGSASIDSTRAARGTHSVHITQPSAISRVVLRETRTFASTGNHFYGRFFLYLNYTTQPLMCDGNSCSNLVHWTAASAGGKYMEGGSTFRPDVRSVGAVNQTLLVNLDGGPKSEVGLNNDTSVPGYGKLDASHANQWMCFEFEYKGKGETGDVRVWWDGRELPAMHYSTARRGKGGELWPIPDYEYLELGFTHYQDYSKFVPSFDAWIDEVAVDSARIGCAL